jgi:hypothetical protein
MPYSNEELNEKSRQDPTFNPRDALWDQQKDMFSGRLADYAKSKGVQNYDGTELGDIERWVKNEGNSGQDASPALQDAMKKIDQRYGQPQQRQPSSGSSSYTSPSSSGSSQGQPSTTASIQYDPRTDPNVQKALAQQNGLITTMLGGLGPLVASNGQNRDTLHGMLMGRATQSLNLDGSDPLIRRQADTYAAANERNARRTLAGLAESAGPYANLASERGQLSEQVGQNNASFESQLVSREIAARRQEIAEALTGLRGQLNTDQQLALQTQMAVLDNLLKQQGTAQNQFSLDTARQSTGNQLLDLMMRNQQYYAGLDSQNDQFAQRLNFDRTDRSSYWDAIRNGTLSLGGA